MSINARSGLEDSATVFGGAMLVNGQTAGFFKGRTFRMYKEFSANTVLRLVATKPFMLTAQSLQVLAGEARAVISVGSTPGGTFVALPTVFPKNGVVSPAPAQDIVITQNGTATGGTEREVLRAAAGSSGLPFSSSVGNGSGVNSSRLLPAGTYYIVITVTGTTAGMYQIEWEEFDS